MVNRQAPARLTFERFMELAAARLGASSPAQVQDRLGLSKQLLLHWKNRGIPSSRYSELADKFEMSIDDMLGREAGTSPAQAAKHATHETGRKLAPRSLAIASAYQALSAKRRNIIDQLIDEWLTDEPPRRRGKDIQEKTPEKEYAKSR